MPAAPQPHHKGIVISMAKKKGNVFSSNKETKILLVDHPESKDVSICYFFFKNSREKVY